MKSWPSRVAKALRRQWKKYRRALNRCQECFTEKAVHDSRVEARRLEAQLELLKVFVHARLHKRGLRTLEQHLDCFDALRDTQVHFLLLRAAPLPPASARPLREALRQREAKCKRTALRDIRLVKVGRLKKVISALVRQLKAAAGDPDRQVRDRRALIRAVDAAHRRVLECRRVMDAGHGATIHRTRVAFKKFRYMVEAMRPLLPGVTAARVKEMHALQSMFGGLQDTDVFLAWLDKHPELVAALATFRHWLLARRSAQIQSCMEHADEFRNLWPLPDAAVISSRAARARPRPRGRRGRPGSKR
jgi:CHAD domain-containing protein